VDPRFNAAHSRDEVRRRFGLEPDRPLVLVMGGGAGVGPMSELAERLASLPESPQVLVLCGTNARLQREVQALSPRHAGRLRAMPFTPHVDLLLEASDMVVSKAGGLTCAESLVKRTPLVIFRPTPGHEVANARYLEAGGAAVHADSLDTVAATVSRWLSDPAALARARESAARLARPRAAEDIARRVLESLPHEGQGRESRPREGAA
jgi:processive 1,2-diacylglycerol beta-glucosyltransferase